MSTVFTPTSEAVRIYECAVLLPITLSEKELGEVLKIIDTIFAEKGASLLHKDDWGRHGLAYKIKKHTEGRYIIYYYELKPEDVKEIDKALHLEKDVLRHLLLRTPKNYEVVDFSSRFAEWKQEQEEEEEEEREKREEELKKKIVQRATKKMAPPKAEVSKKEEGTKKEGAELDEKLQELMSDEDLNL